MKYQNFLRWQCSQQEQKEIMDAVRVCEDRGKFKYLSEIPGGIQFRTAVEPLHNFLCELSSDHPTITFTHEYAKDTMEIYGRFTYQGGQMKDSLLPGNPGEAKELSKQVWDQAADHEAEEYFYYKVDANWETYRQGLLSLSKEALIEKAGEIAAVKLTRDVLARPGLDKEVMEYLDRFENPLEVVSDSWLSEQDGDRSAAFDHVLWVLWSRQDAERDYPLESEYPEQTM